MIAAFVTSQMSRYIAGGMNPETAARFTRGELNAIYKGNHFSRDTSGAMRLTPSPEIMSTESAMKKCDRTIKDFIGSLNKTETPRTIYQGSAAIKHTIDTGIPIKEFFAKSKDNDPSAYTTNLQYIADLWNDGQRRFKAFVRGRFLALDIDRKPGKPDGLKSFYHLFPRETLPVELQELPQSFPCFVSTPSGGFHLYFKHEGAELKLRELALGVEIKEWQITCPGSRRENGEYILHGELSDAPPLYGLIIDAIEKTKQKREREKEERSKPKSRTKATADRPAQFAYPRITLDDLALEAITAHIGHHDRQVSFAGRAYRCKFSGADTLTYVKSRPDIFGNDTDTENTVMSVFRDNGGL